MRRSRDRNLNLLNTVIIRVHNTPFFATSFFLFFFTAFTTRLLVINRFLSVETAVSIGETTDGAEKKSSYATSKLRRVRERSARFRYRKTHFPHCPSKSRRTREILTVLATVISSSSSSFSHSREKNVHRDLSSGLSRSVLCAWREIAEASRARFVTSSP